MTESKTLLLVEDNADDERLLVRALAITESKLHVSVARDGEQAIQMLFGQDDPKMVKPKVIPTAVLVDLKLPKVNGLEFIQIFRKNPYTASIPVIVLSSSSEEIDVVSSYRLGANSYIIKPVSFDDFVETVRFVEQYWFNMNIQPVKDAI
ncbi:MAG: response regulator [Fimbriimonadaceae bacterium]|nr:response regulator [Fimbriimonadaceae bacterium]